MAGTRDTRSKKTREASCTQDRCGPRKLSHRPGRSASETPSTARRRIGRDVTNYPCNTNNNNNNNNNNSNHKELSMQQEGVPRSSSEQGAVVNFQPSVGGGAGGDLEVARSKSHPCGFIDPQVTAPFCRTPPRSTSPALGAADAFRSGRLLRHSTACKMGALYEVMVLNDRLGLLSEEAAHEWKAAEATDPENA